MAIEQLKDSSDKTVDVQAGEACNVVAEFYGPGDAVVLKASLVTLTVTLYDRTTSAVINSRNAQDVLDANNGLVANTLVTHLGSQVTTAVLTLRLGASDSVIVGTVSVGDVQEHVLRLTWTWNDGVEVRPGIKEWIIRVEKMATPA